MRRSVILLAAVVAAAAVAGGLANSAFAYGGGASHDTWQIGLSFNCDNPTICGAQGGEGGFWGWVEFDRWSNGTITGDLRGAGCGHLTGGGGGGGGPVSVDVYAAHLDPNTGDFVIDAASDATFLGDTGIPYTPNHYMQHPAPGITQIINVTYRAAR